MLPIRDDNLHLVVLGRLLRSDIVQFHFACLGTELFLQELTLSSTLSSNPKSSRSIDLQLFHKLLFYLHKFYDKYFIVQRSTRMNEDTRLCYSKEPISINQSSF